MDEKIIAYEDKFKEMQGYLPFLDEIITRIESASNDDSQSVIGIQLSKIKSLKSLLCVTDKRMKIENLLRCEHILKKLKEKIGKCPKQELTTNTKLNEGDLSTDQPDISTKINDSEGRIMNFYKEYIEETPQSPKKNKKITNIESVQEEITNVPVISSTEIEKSSTENEKETPKYIKANKISAAHSQNKYDSEKYDNKVNSMKNDNFKTSNIEKEDKKIDPVEKNTESDLQACRQKLMEFTKDSTNDDSTMNQRNIVKSYEKEIQLVTNVYINDKKKLNTLTKIISDSITNKSDNLKKNDHGAISEVSNSENEETYNSNKKKRNDHKKFHCDMKQPYTRILSSPYKQSPTYESVGMSSRKHSDRAYYSDKRFVNESRNFKPNNYSYGYRTHSKPYVKSRSRSNSSTPPVYSNAFKDHRDKKKSRKKNRKSNREKHRDSRSHSSNRKERGHSSTDSVPELNKILNKIKLETKFNIPSIDHLLNSNASTNDEATLDALKKIRKQLKKEIELEKEKDSVSPFIDVVKPPREKNLNKEDGEIGESEEEEEEIIKLLYSNLNEYLQSKNSKRKETADIDKNNRCEGISEKLANLRKNVIKINIKKKSFDDPEKEKEDKFPVINNILPLEIIENVVETNFQSVSNNNKDSECDVDKANVHENNREKFSNADDLCNTSNINIFQIDPKDCAPVEEKKSSKQETNVVQNSTTPHFYDTFDLDDSGTNIPLLSTITEQKTSNTIDAKQTDLLSKFKQDVLDALKSEISETDIQPDILENIIPKPKENIISEMKKSPNKIDDSSSKKVRRISLEKYKEKLIMPTIFNSKTQSEPRSGLSSKFKDSVDLINRALTPKEILRFDSVMERTVVDTIEGLEETSAAKIENIANSRDSESSEFLGPESPDSTSSFKYIQSPNYEDNQNTKNPDMEANDGESILSALGYPTHRTYEISVKQHHIISMPLQQSSDGKNNSMINPINISSNNMSSMRDVPNDGTEKTKFSNESSDSVSKHRQQKQSNQSKSKIESKKANFPPLTNRFNVGFPVSANYKGKNPKPLLGLGFSKTVCSDNANQRNSPLGDIDDRNLSSNTHLKNIFGFSLQSEQVVLPFIRDLNRTVNLINPEINNVPSEHNLAHFNLGAIFNTNSNYVSENETTSHNMLHREVEDECIPDGKSIFPEKNLDKPISSERSTDNIKSFPQRNLKGDSNSISSPKSDDSERYKKRSVVNPFLGKDNCNTFSAQSESMRELSLLKGSKSFNSIASDTMSRIPDSNIRENSDILAGSNSIIPNALYPLLSDPNISQQLENLSKKTNFSLDPRLQKANDQIKNKSGKEIPDESQYAEMKKVLESLKLRLKDPRILRFIEHSVAEQVKYNNGVMKHSKRNAYKDRSKATKRIIKRLEEMNSVINNKSDMTTNISSHKTKIDSSAKTKTSNFKIPKLKRMTSEPGDCGESKKQNEAENKDALNTSEKKSTKDPQDETDVNTSQKSNRDVIILDETDKFVVYDEMDEYEESYPTSLTDNSIDLTSDDIKVVETIKNTHTKIDTTSEKPSLTTQKEPSVKHKVSLVSNNESEIQCKTPVENVKGDTANLECNSESLKNSKNSKPCHIDSDEKCDVTSSDTLHSESDLKENDDETKLTSQSASDVSNSVANNSQSTDVVSSLVDVLKNKNKIRDMIALLTQSGDNISTKMKKKLELLAEIESDDENDDVNNINSCTDEKNTTADVTTSVEDTSSTEVPIVKKKVQNKISQPIIDDKPVEVSKINKPKGKSRLRNEVDLLRQALPEVFINQGGLVVPGIRMCRLAKEFGFVPNDVPNIKRNTRQTEAKKTNTKKNEPEKKVIPKRKYGLEKELLIVVEKSDISVNKIENYDSETSMSSDKMAKDKHEDKNIIESEEVHKYDSVLPCPKSKKAFMLKKNEKKVSSIPQEINPLNQTSTSDVENSSQSETLENISPPLSREDDKTDHDTTVTSSEENVDTVEKPVNKNNLSKFNSGNGIKKKRRKNSVWTVVNIAKKGKKMGNNKNNKVAPESESSRFFKKNAKLVDLSYYFSYNKKKFHCKYCHKYSGEYIVKHYVSNHPDMEVLISRISPNEANLAIAESENNTENELLTDDLLILNSNNYQCRFCSKSFHKCRKKTFFEHVIHNHTGEYEDKINPDCKEDTLRILKTEFDENNPLLKGFMCEACNFVQTSRENVDKHIYLRHTEKECKVFEINLSKIPLQSFKKHKKEVNANCRSDQSLVKTPTLEIDIPNEITKEDSTTNSTLDNDNLLKTVLQKSVYPSSDIVPGVFSLSENASMLSSELDSINIKTVTSINELDIKEEIVENTRELDICENSIDNISMKYEPLSEFAFENENSGTHQHCENLPANESSILPTTITESNEDEENMEIDLNSASQSCLETNPVYVGQIGVKKITKDAVEYICNINDCSYVNKYFLLFSNHLDLSHDTDTWDGFCKECDKIVLERTSENFSYIQALDHMAYCHIQFHSENGLIDIISKNNALNVNDSPKIQVRPIADLLQHDTEYETPVSESFSNVFPRIENVVSLHKSNYETQEDNCSTSLPKIREYTDSASDKTASSLMICEGGMIINPGSNKNVELFQCAAQECSISTDCFLTFYNHLKEHSAKVSKEIEESKNNHFLWHTCVYCRKNLLVNERLLDHLINEHGHCRFKCQKCVFRGASFIIVFTHSMIMHPEIKDKSRVVYIPTHHDIRDQQYTQGILPKRECFTPYICTIETSKDRICGKKFYEPQSFKQHISTTHKDKKISCQHCKGPPISSSALTKHLRDKHNYNLYKCAYCICGAETQFLILHHLVQFHPSRTPIFYLVYHFPGLEIRAPSEILEVNLDTNLEYHLKNIFGLKINLKECFQNLESINTNISTNIESEVNLTEDINPNILLIQTGRDISITSTKIDCAKSSKEIPDCNQIALKRLLNEECVTITTIDKNEVVANFSDKNIMAAPDPIYIEEPKLPTINIPQTSYQTNTEGFSNIIIVDSDEEDTSTGVENNQNSIENPTRPISKEYANHPTEIIQSDKGLRIENNSTVQIELHSKVSDFVYVQFKDNCSLKCGNNKCFYSSFEIEAFEKHCHECKEKKPSTGFKCFRCKRAIKRFQAYLKHILMHKNMIYTCSICLYSHFHQNNLKTHMFEKHEINRLKFASSMPSMAATSPEKDAVANDNNSEKNNENEPKQLSAKNTDKLTKFGPEDISNLPLIPILTENIFCAVCSFSTKVTSNMLRHLQLHTNKVAVPSVAPVNPVPHLQTNEMHFDKMTNLALSSNIDRPRKPAMSKNVVTNEIPKFIPEKNRFVCGSKNCLYISSNEQMLKQHWSTLHKDESVFHCTHCAKDIMFGNLGHASTEYIAGHLRLHGENLNKCEKCRFLHPTANGVRQHIIAAHGDGSVDRIRGLLNTPEENEKSNNMWECGVCIFSTPSKKEIIEHCSKFHGTSDPYKCGFCSFTAQFKYLMDTHYSLIHNGITIFPVNMYYKKNAKNDARKRNSRSISIDGSSFIEESCATASPAKKIKIASDVDITISRIQGTDNNAEKQSSLKSTSNLPFGEPAQNDYVCPFCKKFSSPLESVMKDHLCEELNYRKWYCEQCDYKAFDTERIRTHGCPFSTDRYHIPKIKQLTPDVEKEKWIENCIKHQSNIITSSGSHISAELLPELVPVSVEALSAFKLNIDPDTEQKDNDNQNDKITVEHNEKRDNAVTLENILDISMTDGSSNEDDNRLIICDDDPDMLFKSVEDENSNYYPCSYCNYVGTCLKGLKLHKREHFDVQPYKCIYCPNYQCVQYLKLKHHYSKIHPTLPFEYIQNKPKEFANDEKFYFQKNNACLKCNSLICTAEIEEHRLKCHPFLTTNMIVKKTKRVYKCSLCPSNFSPDLALLKNHFLLSHPGEDLKFDRSTPIFNNRTNRQIRKAQFNQLEDSYLCSYCPKKLKNFLALFRHHRMKHPKDIIGLIPLKSAQVQDTGEIKKNLKFSANHFQCVISTCKTIFENFDSLKAHVRDHYRIAKCVLCNKSFQFSISYIEHFKTEHPSIKNMPESSVNMQEEVLERITQVNRILNLIRSNYENAEASPNDHQISFEASTSSKPLKVYPPKIKQVARKSTSQINYDALGLNLNSVSISKIASNVEKDN